MIDDVLNRGPWSAAELDALIDRLKAHRELAIRHVVLCHREQRITDDVAALELLGRLASDDDSCLLAEIANDPDQAEAARASSALVLLGQDRGAALDAPDICQIVLRWQARYVAEEPSLRAPLMRLYAAAPIDERARWVSLQDRELNEPAGRAAVLEMLLEVERNRELRSLLLSALAREAFPETRAALRRVVGRSSEERMFVARALSTMASADQAPEGWTARIGFCDGTGCFPLRFDRRVAGARGRCALFVVDLSSGVREALALAGAEIERYDRRSTHVSPDADEPGADEPTLVPISVSEGLGLLADAERRSASCGIPLPDDHGRARRMLDPLDDIPPRRPESMPGAIRPGAATRSAELLDHPGYAGWFFDSGESVLDEARLAVLDACGPGDAPPDGIVDRAARELAHTDRPRRIAEMLRHNAVVHERAGEREWAEVALTAAADAATGEFESLPLARRMIRGSLHPGHYFLSPLSEIPDRHDLACLLLGSGPPTRGRVLTVDLAWILARASEVWLSRLPCHERPPGDLVDRAVLRAAGSGVRWLIRSARGLSEDRLRARLERDRDELATIFRTAFLRAALPTPPSDPAHERLAALFTQAAADLVTDVCLKRCSARCPLHPREDGSEAIEGDAFPGGEAGHARIVNWPGVLLRKPASEHRKRLERFMDALGLEDRRYGAGAARSATSFRCTVCAERRPLTARSRSLVGGDRSAPVCRRCQRRYRQDGSFRARVDAEHGPLVSS